MSKPVHRRSFLFRSLAAIGASIALPKISSSKPEEDMTSDSAIKAIKPLGFQWETADPFLFCVHHEDAFPQGNEQMGPSKDHFSGRHLGDDFIIKDGFRMYHGKTVPGFPGHPHRGFETITVVRKGIVDHADSLGASGRYGNGDVQWMTAGGGVQHSEMFPLIYKDKENPMELFQIWLNLPRKSKMVKPHFKMLWKDSIPIHTQKDVQGRIAQVEIIAGEIFNKTAAAPPPDSWAADKSNKVGIFNILMQTGTSLKLPPAGENMNRTAYYYEGSGMTINGKEIPKYHAVELNGMSEINITAGQGVETNILILQGKPIGEPVIQYGPFVMNTKEEINQAFEDYHRTKFGGWPWPKYDQVHSRDKGRFAKHADGTEEIKQG